MECTGATQAAISIIAGASEPVIEFLDFDKAYASEMIMRGRQFMDFVERREPPVVLPAVPPPIDANKILDMSENEEWRIAAGRWKQTVGAVEIAKGAEKILKALVPADAKKCFGHAVQITRDRANRLSLREQQ
jgi:hypothetical protein